MCDTEIYAMIRYYMKVLVPFRFEASVSAFMDETNLFLVGSKVMLCSVKMLTPIECEPNKVLVVINKIYQISH